MEQVANVPQMNFVLLKKYMWPSDSPCSSTMLEWRPGGLSFFDLKFLWGWFDYIQHLKFWWYVHLINIWIAFNPRSASSHPVQFHGDVTITGFVETCETLRIIVTSIIKCMHTSAKLATVFSWVARLLGYGYKGFEHLNLENLCYGSVRVCASGQTPMDLC